MPRTYGTTSQRGYNAAHKRERAKWKPVIEAGDGWCHAVRCLMRTRWIAPGTRWDLGHTPDGTEWTGPEHTRCNRSEGATRGNRARGARRTPRPRRTDTARRWLL